MKGLWFLQKKCVDLNSISEVRSYITEWPRFWPTLYSVYIRKLQTSYSAYVPNIMKIRWEGIDNVIAMKSGCSFLGPVGMLWMNWGLGRACCQCWACFMGYHDTACWRLSIEHTRGRRWRRLHDVYIRTVCLTALPRCSSCLEWFLSNVCWSFIAAANSNGADSTAAGAPATTRRRPIKIDSAEVSAACRSIIATCRSVAGRTNLAAQMMRRQMQDPLLGYLEDTDTTLLTLSVSSVIFP